MKTFFAILVAGSVSLGLAGCGETHATSSSAHDHAHAPAELAPAAIYKAGYGVQLTASGRSFVGLETGAVSAQAINGREAAAVVPAGAILRTVRGDFVYVENGDWFLRTPVKTGATTPTHAEIAEGLYEGDVIVTRGVRALALTEIQALNGGVGCADGH